MGWLLAIWVVTAGAQPLDLRVMPVTEGVVHSIREVSASKAPAAPQGGLPSTVGVPSDVEETPPVGAVVSRSFGKGSGEQQKWRFGAAGTPDMQERLARTGFDVVVVMADGERRTFRVSDVAGLRPGQRVIVRGGELEPVAGT